MPTLQGKWYFKEHLNLINTNYSFHLYNTDYDGRNIIKVGDNIETYELHVAGSNANLGYGIVYGAGGIFAYADSWQNDAWEDESYRLIEFLEPVTVEEDFYIWFTKNAVPLTIEGTWRFNKTLILPTENLPSAPCLQADIFSTGFSEGQCTSKHYPEYSTGLYFLSLTYTNLPEYNSFGYGLEGNFHEGDNYYCLWTSDSGWVGEEARILTFHDTTELDPKFALWFYKNAHPTDVVLCSEAYVAEIAHNIRQIKGTTQKYAVKNLANEIRNLYINANEEVY